MGEYAKNTTVSSELSRLKIEQVFLETKEVTA